MNLYKRLVFSLDARVAPEGSKADNINLDVPAIGNAAVSFRTKKGSGDGATCGGEWPDAP